ncbi:D-amino-acid transaminase [Chthonobacter albigriseus]|uniref:D-amino-acid transaminase n=1 Tax=Chthonobacter albigriseus TaxID=1683161 RepID=UPI0015EF262A|nr:D-amino-acid transaminase [Chthonobacter albigriseus]
MARIAYVNGRYVPHREAGVSIDDRGLQFGDAVYEVCEVRDGALIDLPLHLDRLEHSLGALGMAMPMPRGSLVAVLKQVALRNKVHYGHLYWQISRGVARRDHGFPKGAASTLIVTGYPGNLAKYEANAAAGVACVTHPDERWARVDIKTTGLLPNVLAKQAARTAGAYEAILVRPDGTVSEGSSTSVWIITQDGTLVTRPPGPEILPGITGAVLRRVAAREGCSVEERPFTVEEAKSAREVFLTSAGNTVMPVVRIDDAIIANGAPGSIATRLRTAYHAYVHRTALQ